MAKPFNSQESFAEKGQADRSLRTRCATGTNFVHCKAVRFVFSTREKCGVVTRWRSVWRCLRRNFPSRLHTFVPEARFKMPAERSHLMHEYRSSLCAGGYLRETSHPSRDRACDTMKSA
jgi:hypothetical protein